MTCPRLTPSSQFSWREEWEQEKQGKQGLKPKYTKAHSKLHSSNNQFNLCQHRTSDSNTRKLMNNVKI